MKIPIKFRKLTEIPEMAGFSQIQTYNPAFSRFRKCRFSPTLALTGLPPPDDSNKVFIKYSPLFDTNRYLMGKYDNVWTAPWILPTNKHTEAVTDKLATPDNASYVDALFCYMSSVCLSRGFVNGIGFYGNLLGVKDQFCLNIADDLEILHNCPTFFEGVNKRYRFDSPVVPMHFFSHLKPNSRRQKYQMCLSESKVSLGTIESLSLKSAIPIDDLPVSEEAEEVEQFIVSNSQPIVLHTDSENNSLLNYTTDGEGDDLLNQSDGENESPSQSEVDEESPSQSEADENDEEADEDDWTSESSQSEEEEEKHMIQIDNFPINCIFLEKCAGTLDRLFTTGQIDHNTTGPSAIFQIIMTLIMYQNAFNFTHNDLHTYNIMYINTDYTHIVYKYKGTAYKVPTYGRIYKIIDFGRSIYTVNGHLFCSDDFNEDSDGHGQYNFEPYYDPSKPVILPNPSFDLCRLACAIYDHVIEEGDNIWKLNLFQNLIQTWCLDDRGRNVLYKQTGEERYPGFKLYKMIARTVHQHTPERQLDYPLFLPYKYTRAQQRRDKANPPVGETVVVVKIFSHKPKACGLKQ
jgi:hypothetical protein